MSCGYCFSSGSSGHWPMHCLPVFASNLAKGSVIGTIAWCFVDLQLDSVVSSLTSAVMRHT